jgi:hypothetical protein
MEKLGIGTSSTRSLKNDYNSVPIDFHELSLCKLVTNQDATLIFFSTVDRILDAYPGLTREMVQAALEYAAAVIDEEQVIARA